MLALLNPVMGWFSDAFKSRFGRRKPFILIATPLMAGSVVALFYPPSSLSPLAMAAWYCAAQFLLNLTSDLYNIPYQVHFTRHLFVASLHFVKSHFFPFTFCPVFFVFPPIFVL